MQKSTKTAGKGCDDGIPGIADDAGFNHAMG